MSIPFMSRMLAALQADLPSRSDRPRVDPALNARRAVPMSDGAVRIVWASRGRRRQEVEALDAAAQRWSDAVRTASAADPAITLAYIATRPPAALLAVRAWAWLVTSYGESLPFDEQAESFDAAGIPEWTSRLTEIDVVALASAYGHAMHAADEIDIALAECAPPGAGVSFMIYALQRG